MCIVGRCCAKPSIVSVETGEDEVYDSLSWKCVWSAEQVAGC